MSYQRLNLIEGTASAPGTGNVTLSDIASAVSWSTVPDGSTVDYVIRDVPLTSKCERGLGTKTTVTGKPTLVRTAGNVTSGASGAGVLVNFTGALQLVYIAPLAEREVLPNVGADPTVLSSGQIWYRTDTSQFRAYNGTTGNVVLTHIPNTFTVAPSSPTTSPGDFNEAWGSLALAAITTGAENCAVGGATMYRLTTGSFNAACGTFAMFAITIGANNTGLGWGCAYSLVDGSDNVAIGAGALLNCVHGNANMALGTYALAACTVSQNTGVGNSALYNVTTGTQNVSLDARPHNDSACVLTTGSYNTLLGSTADTQASSTSYCVALGFSAKAKSNECALSPNINVQTFYGLSSTSTLRPRADITLVNVDNTDATRKYRVVVNVYDTAVREAIRAEANGTAALLGFLGAPAVARQSIGAAATDAGTTQTLVNNIRTALINLGLCTT